jgi:excisionase family DNA binding protein
MEDSKSQKRSNSRTAEYARVSGVAKTLAISERTIWRLIKDGRLRAVKIGSATLIPLNGPGSLAELTGGPASA